MAETIRPPGRARPDGPSDGAVRQEGCLVTAATAAVLYMSLIQLGLCSTHEPGPGARSAARCRALPLALVICFVTVRHRRAGGPAAAADSDDAAARCALAAACAPLHTWRSMRIPWICPVVTRMRMSFIAQDS